MTRKTRKQVSKSMKASWTKRKKRQTAIIAQENLSPSTSEDIQLVTVDGKTCVAIPFKMFVNMLTMLVEKQLQ